MHNGYDRTHAPRSGRDRRRRRARRRLLPLVIAISVISVAAVVIVRQPVGHGTAQTSSSASVPVVSKRPAPTPPPKVWAASTSRPVRVWIGGDSMAGELTWSLQPLLQRAGVFKTITFCKASTGICRYDFFDWGRKIDNVVRTAKPHAAVIMLGANDTQSVWRDGDWVLYGGSSWKRVYERRVGDIIEALFDGDVRRVYLVGMPIMGDAWRNSRMRLINRIFEKQAERHPGATFVDVWELYAKPNGSFDPSLRQSDGVHLTLHGQELLAGRVFEAIERDWRPVRPKASSQSPTASPSTP